MNNFKLINTDWIDVYPNKTRLLGSLYIKLFKIFKRTNTIEDTMHEYNELILSSMLDVDSLNSFSDQDLIELYNHNKTFINTIPFHISFQPVMGNNMLKFECYFDSNPEMRITRYQPQASEKFSRYIQEELKYSLALQLCAEHCEQMGSQMLLAYCDIAPFLDMRNS